jgi:protease I
MTDTDPTRGSTFPSSSLLMGKRVLVAVPNKGFDPTECAVPWKILLSSGCSVSFSTADGGSAACDPIMITGAGLFLLKWSMRADDNGRAAYAELEASGALQKTIPFSALRVEDFDGLLLPGGHCPDMRPYLEDKCLQQFVASFAATGKPIAAVCHGVVLAARSGILQGKQVTALPNFMESTAFNLTRLWMGNYYKTYPGTSVEKEVREAGVAAFLPGPRGFARDSIGNLGKGFVVKDGNLLTGRWPGDCHRLGTEFAQLLAAQGSASNQS